MQMSEIVTMTRDEVRLCSMLAIERWLIKYGSTNKASYEQGKTNGHLEHELNATIRSMVAEWAAAKYFKVSWNMPCYPNSEHPNRKDLPDVGYNGEVRTVRTRDSIAYWGKDKGKILIGCKVLDVDYYSKVEIYGSFEPTFEDGHYDQQSDCYRVPVGQFK